LIDDNTIMLHRLNKYVDEISLLNSEQLLWKLQKNS